MLFDERNVAVVRLPARVEEVANHGHRSGDGIEGNVAEHAQDDRTRRAEPDSGEHDVAGERSAGEVAEPRRNAE